LINRIIPKPEESIKKSKTVDHPKVFVPVYCPRPAIMQLNPFVRSKNFAIPVLLYFLQTRTAFPDPLRQHPRIDKSPIPLQITVHYSSTASWMEATHRVYLKKSKNRINGS